MRKDWPIGCHRWSQGKDSILGKAENVLHTESHGSPGPKDLDEEAEITRCWAKEQELRSRDQVGNLERQVGGRAQGFPRALGNFYGAV